MSYDDNTKEKCNMCEAGYRTTEDREKCVFTSDFYGCGIVNSDGINCKTCESHFASIYDVNS